MGVHRVQCLLTEEEYSRLQDMVSEKGISISQFIKDKLFDKESSFEAFEAIWTEFAEKLENYPAGTEFNVAQIMTDARWKALDRQSKVSVARLFNKKVKLGEYKNIQLIGRSASNVSLYKKEN